MVTVFQLRGAMAKLPKGYEACKELEGAKKPAEAGSLQGAECFTWPQELPWCRQAPQARPLQREQPQQLGLQHLQLPALVRDQLELSRQLGQQALLFCSWLCQNPRPGQRPARSRRPKRPKPRVDCHLECSTCLFSPKMVA